MLRRARQLLKAALALSVAFCCPTQTALCQSPGDSCTSRFGVGVNQAYGDIADYPIGQLHIGWYSDWGTMLVPSRPGGM